jgi:hypothetical protein
MTFLRTELGVAEGVACRELGDLSRAIAQLGVVAAEPTGVMLYCQIIASLVLVHAYLDGGDLHGGRCSIRRGRRTDRGRVVRLRRA